MDPNVTYKTAFAELTTKLGRTPTTRDSGWLEIGNSYSRSWGPAEETVVAPPAAEPVGGSGIIVEPVEAVSVPEPVVSPPRISEGPRVGSRGPGGGILAGCRGCGGVFERPARAGRPPVKCERCR